MARHTTIKFILIACNILTYSSAWGMDRVKTYISTKKQALHDYQDARLHAKLFKAASETDIKKLKKILTHPKIDVNAKDADGNTPLHIVVRRYEDTALRCIDLLTEHGAQIDALNKNGEMPLEIAAGFGAPECIVKLKEKGALQHPHGIRALYTAVSCKRSDIIETLLELGVDPSQTMPHCPPVLRLAFEGFNNTWPRNSIIESLLRAGARIHCLNREQEADSLIAKYIYEPLLHAIRLGDTIQVKRLLNQGASLRINLPRFLDQGHWSLYKYYPLNIATNCQNPNPEMVCYLIDAGGLVDNPYDLLRNSFIHGSLDMAQLLITHVPNYIIKRSWNHIAIPLLCSDRIRTLPKNIRDLICLYCVRSYCIDDQISHCKDLFKTSNRVRRQMSWCTLEESIDVEFTKLKSSNALGRSDWSYYPHREDGAVERSKQVSAIERDNQYRHAFEHILENIPTWQKQIDRAILNRPTSKKNDPIIKEAKK